MARIDKTITCAIIFSIVFFIGLFFYNTNDLLAQNYYKIKNNKDTTYY